MWGQFNDVQNWRNLGELFLMLEKHFHQLQLFGGGLYFNFFKCQVSEGSHRKHMIQRTLKHFLI